MKRSLTVLVLFVIVLCGLSANAQGQFSSVLTKMENSLFGINYDSQNDEVRLKRIEQVVYGETSTKPLPQRVDKLKKDLVADVIGQEIKPKSDTFADDEYSREEIPKADSSVNYPIVNMLENEVFKKEYKAMEINKRLSNLEQKTFKKVYNDDLNTRVDRLKAAIKTDNRMARNNVEDEDQFLEEFNGRESSSYNSNKSVFDAEPGGSDISVQLAALEKSVLRRSYPNDPTSNRLTRLESKMFNTSFVQDEPEVRMDRVSSAFRAQKTAKKYDNNKKAQRMSTAMQIGTMLLMVLAFVL